MGEPHPEYLKYTYRKAYTCNHCGQSFEDYRIFNSKLKADRNKYKKMRYDLRQAYVDFEPYWYELVTCPHCYFTAFSICFLEGRNTVAEEYEELLCETAKKISMNFKQEKEINFVFLQHYLALICSQGVYGRSTIQSRLWKNLTWIYEDVGDEEMRKFATARAANAMSEAYSRNDSRTEAGMRIALTAAYMYRTCGNVSEAKNWALKVCESEIKNVYSKLAKELLEEC